MEYEHTIIYMPSELLRMNGQDVDRAWDAREKYMDDMNRRRAAPRLIHFLEGER